MSYDRSSNLNARSARQWRQPETEDVARGEFLRALDKASFEVTDFEARFIESFFANASLNWWTPARRETCDKMRKTYGARL